MDIFGTFGPFVNNNDVYDTVSENEVNIQYIIYIEFFLP